MSLLSHVFQRLSAYMAARTRNPAPTPPKVTQDRAKVGPPTDNLGALITALSIREDMERLARIAFDLSADEEPKGKAQ